MIDTIVRGQMEAVESNVEDKPMAKSSGDPVSEVGVTPPFTDYEKMKGKPYIVEYFDIGNMWDRDDTYSKEVRTIEDYLKLSIEEGMDNSVEAVRERLKEMEVVAGVDKIDRLVIKIGKVAAYARFLREVESVKRKARRYV